MAKEKSKDKKKEEIDWDKKRILIFLILGIFFIYGAIQVKNYILGGSDNLRYTSVSTIKQSVKGVNTPDIAKDVKDGLQSKIQQIRSDAQNINIVEVASSSPQVQKIINDLKSLQDLPKNQIKEACEKVCSGL